MSIAALMAAGAAAVLFWPAREPPPQPAAKPEPPGPKFARFDIPTENVKVRVVGQGFEVINTDPNLTGTQVEFAGVTEDGKRIPYSVKLPPPVPTQAQP